MELKVQKTHLNFWSTLKKLLILNGIESQLEEILREFGIEFLLILNGIEREVITLSLSTDFRIG